MARRAKHEVSGGPDAIPVCTTCEVTLTTNVDLRAGLVVSFAYIPENPKEQADGECDPDAGCAELRGCIPAVKLFFVNSTGVDMWGTVVWGEPGEGGTDVGFELPSNSAKSYRTMSFLSGDADYECGELAHAEIGIWELDEEGLTAAKVFDGSLGCSECTTL